ncbi:hypothetical protein GCM10010289_05020 [Streptomyces violascens]|uniref:Uncharacterized protein n=1 Tax=Streptomyces violascens TaxID=67381 RepID=A0ABQ3QFW6_9ACTN|nr:hypothetical protein GCM10010289_05020 [Streptomyces violascens]GHI36168.1 hypothetical protein Sviol_05760 [Streptomyces violascens]
MSPAADPHLPDARGVAPYSVHSYGGWSNRADIDQPPISHDTPCASWGSPSVFTIKVLPRGVRSGFTEQVDALENPEMP